MKKNFFRLLIILFFILLSFSPSIFAATTPDFSLNSTAAYLLDASSRSNTL